MAEPVRAAEPRLRRPLPQARVVGGPRGVHRARPGLGLGVQPPVRAPVRVDLDQSEDAGLVRQALDLNFAHYFRAATLDQFGRPSRPSPIRPPAAKKSRTAPPKAP